MDRLNILLGKAHAIVDKSLSMVNELVSPGRLEPILTQVHSLTGPLQVPLHELYPRNQAIHNPDEVPMPLDVSGDTPRGNFVDFLIQDLPVCLIRMHGHMEPVGHWLEGFIIIIKRGFCVYVHDVRHCVDGGPHGVGGNAPVVKVLYPFWQNEVSLFVWDLGIGCAMLIVGLKAVGASVHVMGYFKFFLNAVFELLDMGCLFVLFCKVINIPLAEGGHETVYDGPKHVSHEPCKAVSCNLG